MNAVRRLHKKAQRRESPENSSEIRVVFRALLVQAGSREWGGRNSAMGTVSRRSIQRTEPTAAAKPRGGLLEQSVPCSQPGVCLITLVPSSCLPLHLGTHSLCSSRQSLLSPSSLPAIAPRPGSPRGQASPLKGYISIPAVQALPCLLEAAAAPAEV